MVRHLSGISGGSVLTAPTPADLLSEESGPDVEKYMRTTDGVDAQYRSRHVSCDSGFHSRYVRRLAARVNPCSPVAGCSHSNSFR